MFVAYFEILAVTLAFAFVRGLRRIEDIRLPKRFDRTAALVAALTCTCLALSVFAQIAIDTRGAAAQIQSLHMRDAPLAVILDYVPGNGTMGNFAIVLGIAQTCLLWLLKLTLDRHVVRRWVWAIVGGCCLAMLAMAFASHVVRSSDIYTYVGYGILGDAAYAPPRTAFAPPYSVINEFWGAPIVPSPYGPIWIAISRGVTFLTHDLAHRIAAFRIIEIGAFFGCIAALARMRVSKTSIACFALNPALIQCSIIDGHNDLLPIMLVLCAMAAARYPVLRFALFGGAIGIKLPFFLIAASSFAATGPVLRKPFFLFGVAVAGIALSLFFGGMPYVHALVAEGTRRALPSPATILAHAAVVACILALLWSALVRRKYLPGGSLAFMGLGVIVAPWYALWGLPYAIAAEGTAYFLVSLPLVTNLFSISYEATTFRLVVHFFVIASLLGAIGISAIRRRPALARAP